MAASASTKKGKTLEEEIRVQREKLRRLEEQQKEVRRKEQERNAKAVLEMLRAEKLDVVPVAQWKVVMPAIKAALLAGSAVESASQEKPNG